jgi:DNA-binding transcriptional LysR family regulator
MPDDSIDLRRVRHLRAVATHPTLQAAAEALHLTQPALTKSIARFEEELGAKLFDRRGRKLVLTELGQRMVQRGEALLRHVRAIEEEVDLWQGLGTGEVMIGVGPETELGLLPRVLEAFVPAHPGVTVSVRSGATETLLPALLDDEVHFLVTDAEIAEGRPELEITPLPPRPIAAAVRPGHPLVRKRRPTPKETDGLPLLGAFTSPRFERWRQEAGRREVGEPFRPSLLCDNYEVLVRLAESSDAIVFGPTDLLGAYERAGRLRVTSWPVDGPESQASVIRTRDREFSPAARRLMALFEESAGSAPPNGQSSD